MARADPSMQECSSLTSVARQIQDAVASRNPQNSSISSAAPPASGASKVTEAELALANLIEKQCCQANPDRNARKSQLGDIFTFYSERVAHSDESSSLRGMSVQQWKMLLSDCGVLNSSGDQQIADTVHMRARAALVAEIMPGTTVPSSGLDFAGFVLALAQLSIERSSPSMRAKLRHVLGGEPDADALTEAATSLDRMLRGARTGKLAVDGRQLLEPAAVRSISEHETELQRLFYHRAVRPGSGLLDLEAAVQVARDCLLFPRLLTKETIGREFKAVGGGLMPLRYSGFVELFGRLALASYSRSEFKSTLPDAGSKLEAAFTAFEGSEAMDEFTLEERQRGVDVGQAVTASQTTPSPGTIGGRSRSIYASQDSSPTTAVRDSRQSSPGSAASGATQGTSRARLAAKRRASVTTAALAVQEADDASLEQQSHSSLGGQGQGHGLGLQDRPGLGSSAADQAQLRAWERPVASSFQSDVDASHADGGHVPMLPISRRGSDVSSMASGMVRTASPDGGVDQDEGGGGGTAGRKRDALLPVSGQGSSVSGTSVGVPRGRLSLDALGTDQEAGLPDAPPTMRASALSGLDLQPQEQGPRSGIVSDSSLEDFGQQIMGKAGNQESSPRHDVHSPVAHRADAERHAVFAGQKGSAQGALAAGKGYAEEGHFWQSRLAARSSAGSNGLARSGTSPNLGFAITTGIGVGRLESQGFSSLEAERLELARNLRADHARRTGFTGSLAMAMPGSSASSPTGAPAGFGSPPRSPKVSRRDVPPAGGPQHRSRVDEQLVAGIQSELEKLSHKASDAFFFYCRIDDPGNRGEMSAKNFVRLLRDAGFFEGTGVTVHEVQLQLVIMARNRSHHKTQRERSKLSTLDAADDADARTASTKGRSRAQSPQGSVAGTSKAGSVSRSSVTSHRGRRGSIIGGAASTLASEAVLDMLGFIEAVARCCELRRTVDTDGVAATRSARNRRRRQGAAGGLDRRGGNSGGGGGIGGGTSTQQAAQYSRRILLEDIAPLGEVAKGYEKMVERIESVAVVNTMRSSRKLLQRLFTYFCDAREGDDSSQILRLPQLVKLCKDCELLPRLISRPEIEAVFFHIARRHGTDATTGGGPVRGVTGTAVGGYRRASVTQAVRSDPSDDPGAGQGMDASYLHFPGFVECLGVFALQGLAQPFLHRMYPRAENKVEGIILWIRSSGALRKIQSEDHQRGYGRRKGRTLSKKAAAGEVIPADIDGYSKLVAQIRPELRPGAGGSGGGRARRGSVFAALMEGEKKQMALLQQRQLDPEDETMGGALDAVNSSVVSHDGLDTATAVDSQGQGETGSLGNRPPPPPPPKSSRPFAPAQGSEDDGPVLDDDTAPAVAVALRILAAALDAAKHGSGHGEEGRMDDSGSTVGADVKAVLGTGRADIEAAILAVADVGSSSHLPPDVAAVAAEAARSVALTRERNPEGSAVSDIDLESAIHNQETGGSHRSASASRLLRIAAALESVAQGPTPGTSPARGASHVAQAGEAAKLVRALASGQEGVHFPTSEWGSSRTGATEPKEAGPTSAHRGLAPAPQHVSAYAVSPRRDGGRSTGASVGNGPTTPSSALGRSYASMQRPAAIGGMALSLSGGGGGLAIGGSMADSGSRTRGAQGSDMSGGQVTTPREAARARAARSDAVLEWLEATPLARGDEEKAQRISMLRSVRDRGVSEAGAIGAQQNRHRTSATWMGGLRRSGSGQRGSRTPGTGHRGAPSPHVPSHPYEPVGSTSMEVSAEIPPTGGAGAAVLDFRGVVEHVHRAERGRAWKRTQDWIQTQRVDLSSADGFNGSVTTPRAPRLATDHLAMARSGRSDKTRGTSGSPRRDWVASQARIEIAREAELAASRRTTGMTPIPPPLWASKQGDEYRPPLDLKDTLRSVSSTHGANASGAKPAKQTVWQPTKPQSFALRALARAKERNGVLFSSVAAGAASDENTPVSSQHGITSHDITFSSVQGGRVVRGEYLGGARSDSDYGIESKSDDSNRAAKLHRSSDKRGHVSLAGGGDSGNGYEQPIVEGGQAEELVHMLETEQYERSESGMGMSGAFEMS